jgi:acyl carrier protein
MTSEEARRLILDAIAEVAPEADLEHIDVEQHLQEQLDLDSMDFLAILTTIGEQTGLDLPESDYPRLAALGPAVDYLVAATGRS